MSALKGISLCFAGFNPSDASITKHGYYAVDENLNIRIEIKQNNPPSKKISVFFLKARSGLPRETLCLFGLMVTVGTSAMSCNAMWDSDKSQIALAGVDVDFLP